MKNRNTPLSTSPLSIWLLYLKNLHDKTIDMGIDRVAQVASRLDVLRPAPFVFTVAGTNGKGTTCRTLEAILLAAGYHVGVYSSPHLLRYTERIRVQDAELPESKHIASFSAIENVRGDITLTYFEFSTISALWLFKQEKLDVVILEVGLGGRLDATNIVDSDIAVITSIALDHTNWLGKERESIGREKAGIFRFDKPAIMGDSDTPKSVMQIAKEKNVQLLRYNHDWNFTIAEKKWIFEDEKGKLFDLPLPNVPQQNAATSLAALRASGLKVSQEAIYKGISNANLPGRFQIISQSPRLILDVAHNPHAATYLAKQIKPFSTTGCIFAVIGMLHDKDISGTLSCMKKVVNFWYCASLSGARGASAEQLVKYLEKGKPYKNVIQAWHAAMSEAREEDTVVVCGSFHTVARVMETIGIKEISLE